MNFFNMGFNNQTIGIHKGTKPIHMVNSQKQKLDFVIITQKEPTNKQGIFGGITLSFHGHIMNMYIYIYNGIEHVVQTYETHRFLGAYIRSFLFACISDVLC